MVQPSSQSWPMDTKLWFMSGRMFVVVASGESGKSSCASLFDMIRWLLGNRAATGFLVISEGISSSSPKKCRVHPVSAMLWICCLLCGLSKTFMLCSPRRCHSGLFAWEPPMLFVHVALFLWFGPFCLQFLLLWMPGAPGGKYPHVWQY